MEDKKKERLFSMLEKQGIHKASKYFEGTYRAKKASYPDIVDVVPGAERIATSFGDVVYRRLEVPVSDDPETPRARGYTLPGEKYIRHLTPAVTGRLADLEKQISIHDFSFLDIETTGLAGGTGTYPILIGLGRLKEDIFDLEQFFMEDYDRESAVLSEVQTRLKDCAGFVTYNGKSFDIPVLASRFTLNRLRIDWEKPHIDLLHLVRRLWKGTLSVCSLDSVESNILGIRRLHNIEGAMIPAAYFDYVRRREPSLMALAFDHNAQDVISMASILARIAYYYQHPEDDEVADTLSQLGLSKLYERHGDIPHYLESMERALFYCSERKKSYTLSCHIARIYKRLGRWDSAIEIWQSYINSNTIYTLEPFVEMAKYFEHQAREHGRAIKIVQRAIELLDERRDLDFLLGTAVPFEAEKIFEELTYRLTRLKRRIGTEIDNTLSEEEEDEDKDFSEEP